MGDNIHVFVGFIPGWEGGGAVTGVSLVTVAELFVRKLEMKP